jgi:hypothetical protein
VQLIGQTLRRRHGLLQGGRIVPHPPSAIFCIPAFAHDQSRQSRAEISTALDKSLLLHCNKLNAAFIYQSGD